MSSNELLMFILVVGFIGYIIMNHGKDRTRYIYTEKDDTDRVTCGNPSCINAGVCGCRGLGLGQGLGIGRPPMDPLRQFDYDAIGDDFTPPFRRSYYDESDYRLVGGLYPTYTRGPVGRFRKVGTLVATGVNSQDKYKFLNLMGREKYPGREFEYFATSVDTDIKVKFYIETRGREIVDEDRVTIHQLEGYEFRFKEDPDLSPRYDPYLV